MDRTLLLPNRKDPYSPEDIAAVWALAPGQLIAGRALHWTDPFWVSWWAQLQLTRYVGFRKAEVTLTVARAAAMLATPSGVLLALSFAHLAHRRRHRSLHRRPHNCLASQKATQPV